MIQNTLRQSALNGILEFCARHDLNITGFGRRFAGDVKFVRKLRNGDNVGLVTLERLGARMQAFEAAGGFELTDDYDQQPWSGSLSGRRSNAATEYRQGAE